jgi:4'-phosphopantetheinyl transferase
MPSVFSVLKVVIPFRLVVLDVTNDARASVIVMVVEIHLTYWLTNAMQEEAPADALDALSTDERIRCTRFLFGRDRRDFAAAHALLRAALSSTADRARDEWRFEAGSFGKPRLAATIAASTPISFNLAHTRGLVACAVVKQADVDVGVDVEAIARHYDLAELTRRFFSSAEAAEILRHEGEDRERRFFELWTLKEAFIKALGEGLSHPLDSFCFGFDGDGSLRFESSNIKAARTWHFALLDVIGRYCISLAFHGRSSMLPRVVLHEATSVDARVAPSASLVRRSPRLVVDTARAEVRNI